jgi:hypothetical protein
MNASLEITSRSAIDKFPKILRKPKIHFRFHNNLPLILALSHEKPVQATTNYSYPHINIILPPKSILIRDNFLSAFALSMRATCSTYTNLFQVFLSKLRMHYSSR